MTQPPEPLEPDPEPESKPAKVPMDEWVVERPFDSSEYLDRPECDYGDIQVPPVPGWGPDDPEPPDDEADEADAADAS